MIEFGIVESTENHGAGIAGIGGGVGIKDGADPCAESGFFGGGGLVRGIGRGHFAIIEHFDDPLPWNDITANVGYGLEAFEIEITLLFGGGVAGEAVLFESWLLCRGELLLEGSEVW